MSSRSKPIRALVAVIPTLLTIAAIRIGYDTGAQIQVPFLLLLASVVFAGAFGSLVSGVVAGTAASGVVVLGHAIGFGPATLTGTIPGVIGGIAIYSCCGYFLGRLHEQRDQHLAEVLAAQRREQEEPLLLASQLVKMGYYVWDVTTDEAIIVSEQHARNNGLTVAEFKARASRPGGDFKLVHPDDREKVEQWCVELESGQQVEMEYRIPTADGIKWLRAIARPFFNEDGVVEKEICASLDITEQKLIEQNLAEAQKLDSVGRLSAGIAHDFNNLLAVILGNIELVATRVSEPETRELLRSASQAVERGADLTQQLLAFGRKAPLVPEVVDGNAIIRASFDLWRRTIPANIKIEIASDGAHSWFKSDRAQLDSALLNLVINARDAMPDGGVLRIKSERVEIVDRLVDERGLSIEPGRFVLISIADTGCGVPLDRLDKIWTPFFTTKPVGEGSGLGLPMVYGFVKQSGGYVQLYSSPEKGATVRMYFPEVSGPVEWSEILPGKRQSGAPSGSRILLVEDEPGVRDAVRRQLEHLGYEVLTANNGDEGLRLLKSGGDVNLLLTDAVLPGVIQGHQLAEIAEAEFPDMKVIMVSGYAHDSRDDAEKSGKTSYPRLMKPVSIADLEKAITATLKPD